MIIFSITSKTGLMSKEFDNKELVVKNVCDYCGDTNHVNQVVLPTGCPVDLCVHCATEAVDSKQIHEKLEKELCSKQSKNSKPRTG